MKFKHLFEPLELKDLLLRNRFTMSAMPTGFSCTKGYVTRKMVSYYASRAKGGASLIPPQNGFSGLRTFGKFN